MRFDRSRNAAPWLSRIGIFRGPGAVSGVAMVNIRETPERKALLRGEGRSIFVFSIEKSVLCSWKVGLVDSGAQRHFIGVSALG